MRWIFFPHGGSQNHGCEALARTIASMVGKADPKASMTLYSIFPESDRKYGLDKIFRISSCNVFTGQVNKIKGLLFRLKAKIGRKNIDDLMIADAHKIFKNHDVALSIGGDNYCYPGMQHVLSEQNIAVRFFNKPAILWGCSLDETLLFPKVISELRQYKAIIARETITYNILHQAGIKDNVFLATDPAFILPEQPTDWPEERLRGKKIVGVNISPLINRYGQKGLIHENYRNLLEEILKEPDTYVALIPHVEQENNNDYEMAVELVSGMDEKDRISIIPNGYNCMQLKSLIAKCHSFVGCRTHATIAAYSSLVPTLVVGYSNKSKGIARDIFGDESGLVIPVQEFVDSQSLANSYKSFVERRSVLKKHLGDVMPSYSRKAWDAVAIFKQID